MYSYDDNNQSQELDGMYKAASDAAVIYPGWQVRVYHGPDISQNFLIRLAKLGPHVKLVNVSELPEWSSYQHIDPFVWRFLVASDPTVTAYAIRDANSALSIREKAAVDEWLASGKEFHIMRDHPLHHPMRGAILPGMFGGLQSAVPEMSVMLTQFYAENKASLDGNDNVHDHDHALAHSFLWKKILPLAAKKNCMQHDSYYCEETGGIAFPMTRVKAGAPHDFIGDVYSNAGKWGNGQTPSNLPDMQKCLIIEKTRSRYLSCLRQRQDKEVKIGKNMTLAHQYSTTYTGPMESNLPRRDETTPNTCKPNQDDEFYSLDRPTSEKGSLKLLVVDGRKGGKLGGNVRQVDSTRSIQRVHNSYSYRFWSSDFHIAPIADVKHVFKSWDRTKDYHIYDESASGHCELEDTCASNLRVINRANGLALGVCPNELKREFWREYAHDERMETVDAFFCHHATGLCEMFMAFGRPLIAIVSTRYEIGRTDAWAWSRLNANLNAIASDPRNTIAANNRYDAEYIKHFTGLKEVRVVPNYCGYIEDTYNPTQREILIGPGRMSVPGKKLRDQLKLNAAIAFHKEGSLANKRKGGSPASTNNNLTLPLEFISIREKYGRFKYSDLAAHPAIVLIPYQVSIMSVFEYYRMGIPMFAPSPKLLAKWQHEEIVMLELTWNCVKKECDKKSSIKAHPDSPHGDRDPNDMSSNENIAYWIKYADFYLLPEITLYDSWKDLFEKIRNANLNEIHKRMMALNEVQKSTIKDEWTDILDRAFNNTPPRWQSMKADISGSSTNKGDLESSWEEAVLRNYPSVAVHTNITC